MNRIKTQNPSLVMITKYNMSNKETLPIINKWLVDHPNESHDTLSNLLKLGQVILKNKILSSIPKPSPVEAIRLIKEIKESKSLTISNHTYHLKEYKNCFIGSELVDWFKEHKGLITEEALLLGNHLSTLNLIKHTKNEHDFKNEYLFYHFTLPNMHIRLSPIEIIDLIQEIKQSETLEIKNRPYKLTNYSQCFLGSELVQWLKKNKKMTSCDAISLGQELIRNEYIMHVTNDHDFKNEGLFYQFLIKYEHHETYKGSQSI